MADMKRNEPGMDDDQAQHDRNNWDTTVPNLTKGENVMAFGGPVGQEVGIGYDIDPLGEEYHPVTYGNSDPMPADMGSGKAAPSQQMEERSSGGGMRASAPQNYTKGEKV